MSFGFLLAFWIVASTVVNVRERTRGTTGGIVCMIRRQPRSYWGMILAHLGVAVFIVGVTLVKGYETERDVQMKVGDTVQVGGYVFRFDGVTDRKGPNYTAARGAVAVSRNGTVIETLYPEKRAYNAGGMPMTNAAIDSGITGDIYVSMGEPVDRRRVDHPRLFEAIHHVGVGGIRADGAGRLPRADGPPLPDGRSDPSPLRRALRRARRGLGMHTS